MSIRNSSTDSQFSRFFATWREHTLSRRRFLLGLTGGSLALLFPLHSGRVSAETSSEQRWRIIEAVQDQLFPSEPQAPGARELNALEYLKWAVGDAGVDEKERRFILSGVDWLEDMSRQVHEKGFLELNAEQQDQLLRRIARSEAGENWLATLLLYLFEALLTDPIYGGNLDSIGWRWLGHRPGFPRPNELNKYKAG